jgi:hypothetical protein
LDFDLLSKLAVFVLGLFLIGYMAGWFITSWYLGSILMILSSLMLMFITKLLRLKDLYRIIRFDEVNEES